jgi:hypothetical protein
MKCLTPGGYDSGWQDSPSYTDAGLSPSTTYTYQVTARDKSANETAPFRDGSRNHDGLLLHICNYR